MKNGCKMAAFFHRDALFFASRRNIFFIATHQFFRRDVIITPSRGIIEASRWSSFKPLICLNIRHFSVFIIM